MFKSLKAPSFSFSLSLNNTFIQERDTGLATIVDIPFMHTFTFVSLLCG